MKVNIYQLSILMLTSYSLCFLITIGVIGSINESLLAGSIYVIWLFFFHIYTHELGHLIFGIMTGYRLVSFKLGLFLIDLQPKNKFLISFQGQELNAQCFMYKKNIDNNENYVLYQLGGALLNVLLSSVVAWRVFASQVEKGNVLLFFLTGLSVGVSSLIPVDYSDGKTFLALIKNSDTRTKISNQQYLIAQLSLGKTFSEIDSKYFVLPEDKWAGNYLYTSLFFANYYKFIELGKLRESSKILACLLEEKNSILPIYKESLIHEELFAAIYINRDKDFAKSLYQKIDFSNSYKLPSIENYRVQIAYKMLVENNKSEAEEIYLEWEKRKMKYPDKGIVYFEDHLVKKIYFENVKGVNIIIC